MKAQHPTGRETLQEAWERARRALGLAEGDVRAHQDGELLCVEAQAQGASLPLVEPKGQVPRQVEHGPRAGFVRPVRQRVRSHVACR
jgi:hypothetical protein